MSFTEMPPMLTGDSKGDLRQLRDYLFRMARSLGEASSAPAVVSSSFAVSGSDKKTLETVRRNADELRSLIIKSADEVTAYVDTEIDGLSSTYVAQSEYGTFAERISSSVATNSAGVTENYNLIESVNSEMQNYFTTIDGQIRRGYIEDPDNNNSRVIGIAISQNLQFSGETVTDGAYTYYHLTSGQTFGMYTSTGWQFWIGGHKVGWFDSTRDGILHVRKVVAEELFQVGGKWQMKVAAGGSELEFVYIGG